MGIFYGKRETREIQGKTRSKEKNPETGTADRDRVTGTGKEGQRENDRLTYID